MNSSESIIKIAPALLAAQEHIGAATKGSNNPFFKSKYADLGSVMECCKEALNDNGISVLQPIICIDGNVAVETILMHDSGEWISGAQLIVCKEPNNPQAQGSAITYARRYSLQSMLFIPAEDDDANKATSQKSAYQEQKTYITEVQHKKLEAEITARKVDRDKLKTFFGIDHLSKIESKKFNEILEAVQSKPIAVKVESNV
jgi:hypothetical protein